MKLLGILKFRPLIQLRSFNHSASINKLDFWTKKLTTYTEQRLSCEASISANMKDIPCVLWNSQRHYVIHNHLLARFFCFTTSYSLSWKSSWFYVFLSMLRTSEYSLSFSFRHQNPRTQYSSPPYKPQAPQIPPSLIRSHDSYLLRRSHHESPCYVIFRVTSYSCLGPNCSLIILFLCTRLFYFSFNKKPQVSHPYK